MKSYPASETSQALRDAIHHDARFMDSSQGMHATADELRRAARQMLDSNDRAAMLRIAAGYEQRAEDMSRRQKSEQAQRAPA